ncbi:MAG: anthranilate phosphoribosyltransferase [Acidimicrobiia bacterium]|nr:anthranilate phosphoribosyltransferase [Acidimicrobiia bacterium]
MITNQFTEWPQILGPLLQRHDLTTAQARSAMAEVLGGRASAAQVAAFIVALRVKGETVDELKGLLGAMLDAADQVTAPAGMADRLVDTCGTGGDRSHSINVSTLAALVVAGAGVPVGKHGGRSASSACGSADLLEEFGVAIELSPAGVEYCLVEAGMAFLFAPKFHSAMRFAGPIRKELGVPTVFNILGPMANPLRPRRQVLGVGDWTMAHRMAEVLQSQGTLHAMVVQGHGELDELALAGPSRVLEVRGDRIQEHEIDPVLLGLAPAPLEAVVGGNAATNAAISHRIFDGERGAGRDIVVLNAAAGLLVGDAGGSMADGVELAQAVIDDGRAVGALERLVKASNAAREM